MDAYGQPDATDRCDGHQCGARAYVVTEINGTEMLWCSHHWHTGEAKLTKLATAIRDYTFLLEG